VRALTDKYFYKGWVTANVGDDHGYGRCKEISERMVEAFPHLSLRKGFFYSLMWGRRTHWWCRDDGGNIVDPTARQYPDGIIFPPTVDRYEDLTDCADAELYERVPSSKCMDCGEWVYRGAKFCNADCEARTMEMLREDCPL